MLIFNTLLIVAEDVRLLRECESKGDPTGARAEEAPEPPAESERLQRKETAKFRSYIKIIHVLYKNNLSKMYIEKYSATSTTNGVSAALLQLFPLNEVSSSLHDIPFLLMGVQVQQKPNHLQFELVLLILFP